MYRGEEGSNLGQSEEDQERRTWERKMDRQERTGEKGMTSGRLRKSSMQDRRKHTCGRKYTHEPQEFDSNLHIIVRGRQDKQNGAATHKAG